MAASAFFQVINKTAAIDTVSTEIQVPLVITLLIIVEKTALTLKNCWFFKVLPIILFF